MLKTIKKLKFKRKYKNPKKDKQSNLKKVTDVLPFLDIKSDYIVLKSEFVDVLEIEGKDILSLTKNELERDIDIFHSFYKTCSVDIKFVSMKFPVNTQSQREYITYKISITDNPIYQKFLYDKLHELEFLEKNRTNKEYYIFIYSTNLDKLNSDKNSLMRILSHAVNIKTIPAEKKKLILYKLNNKNSKIDIGGGFIE